MSKLAITASLISIHMLLLSVPQLVIYQLGPNQIPLRKPLMKPFPALAAALLSTTATFTFTAASLAHEGARMDERTHIEVHKNTARKIEKMAKCLEKIARSMDEWGSSVDGSITSSPRCYW